MKKAVFLSLISLFALSATMVSCSNKDNASSTVKPPISGIVILNTEQKVIKGQEFFISFRANPSGAGVIDIKNIELDALVSDTYELMPSEVDKPQATTKASYVTPSNLLKCVDIVPDSNALKEPLEGQWRMRVKTSGEGNFMNKTLLYVVFNYLDPSGKTQRISSSSPINLQIYPTVEEGVVIGYSKGQTYRAASDKTVLPYMIMLNGNSYKNKAGEKWQYDNKLISSAEVAFEEPVFSVKPHIVEGYISLTPSNAAKWTNFEASADISTSTSANIVLTDISESKLQMAASLTYYKSEIELPFTFSAAEVNAQPEVLSFKFNILPDVAKLGYTPDINVNLWHTSTAEHIDAPIAVDMLLQKFNINGLQYGKTVSAEAAFGRMMHKPVTPGTTPPNKISSVKLSFSTWPQNQSLTETKFRLIDVKVTMPITVID